MAEGFFSKTLVADGWFDKTAQADGWFDDSQLQNPASVLPSTITISENTGATYSGLFAVSNVESDANANYYTSSGRFGRSGEIQSFQPTDRCNAYLIASGISNVTAGGTVSNAKLRIYFHEVSQNFTIKVHQVYRAQVMNQITWNNYSTGNAWQTAGGYGALDRDSAVLAESSMTNGQAAGYVEFAGTALNQFIQDVIDGVITLPNLMMAIEPYVEFSYSFFYNSLYTDGFRPELVFDYAVAGGGNEQALAITTDNASFNIQQTLNRQQSLSLTTDNVAFSIAQVTSHPQSLALTTDNATFSISQTLNHSQSVSLITDSAVFNINQTLNHSQSLNLLTDSVTFNLQQVSTHPQLLSLVTDDNTFNVNQILNHSQSFSLTSDDVSFSIVQTKLGQIGQFLTLQTDDATFSINQLSQHSQNLTLTTDNVLFNIAQLKEGAKAQSFSLLTDNVTFTTLQTVINNQSIAITTDSVSFNIRQSKAYNQSVSLMTDDVQFNIVQIRGGLVYGNIDYYIATGRELMHIVGNRAYNYTSTARNYTHEA